MQERARLKIKDQKGKELADKWVNMALDLRNMRNKAYMPPELRKAEDDVSKVRQNLKDMPADFRKESPKYVTAKRALDDALARRLAIVQKQVDEYFKEKLTYPNSTKTYAQVLEEYRQEVTGVPSTEIAQARAENVNDKYDNTKILFATNLPVDRDRVQKVIDALAARAVTDPKVVERVKAEDEGRELTEVQQIEKQHTRTKGQEEAEGYLKKKMELEHMLDMNFVPLDVRQADARVAKAQREFEAVGTRGDTNLALAKVPFDAFKKAAEDRVTVLADFAKANVKKAEQPVFKNMIKVAKDFAASLTVQDNTAGLWSYMRSLNTGYQLTPAERTNVINDHYKLLENEIRQKMEKVKNEGDTVEQAKLQKQLDALLNEVDQKAKGRIGNTNIEWGPGNDYWSEAGARQSLNMIRKDAGLNPIKEDWSK
jgi:hypothetical protein